MQGWIKLHRQLIKWEWWDDHNTTRLFIYLLLEANHEDKKWQGVVVKRGQKITSYPKLSKNTGISIQSIRTSLNKLKSTDELTVKSTSKYTVISINNYDSYQETNTQTNSQLTVNQQATNNKQECKELKNVKKKDKGINSLTEDYCKKVAKHYDIPLSVVIKKRGDLILYCKANGKKYKDYQSALQGWVRRDLRE